MKRIALATVLVLASLSVLAIDPARLADPLLQQRYEKLTHELKCLQCQGETIADTPAQFAVDIRRQVREMLQAGKTDAEVKQYMVDRYDDIILLKPRWSAANAWLWLAPGVLLLGGMFIAWRVLRQRRELLAADTTDIHDEAERP